MKWIQPAIEMINVQPWSLAKDPSKTLPQYVLSTRSCSLDRSFLLIDDINTFQLEVLKSKVVSSWALPGYLQIGCWKCRSLRLSRFCPILIIGWITQDWIHVSVDDIDELHKPLLYVQYLTIFVHYRLKVSKSLNQLSVHYTRCSMKRSPLISLLFRAL